MKSRSEVLCETWLKPIVNLIGEGEFSEAYALVGYFPSTCSRQLVQLAALLGQNKVTEADTLLRNFAYETQSLVTDFATILSQIDFNLLEVGYQAIQNKHFELGDFCLEFQLRTHAETIPAVVDGLLQIAAQMLAADYFDRGRAYLERAIKLDNSPARLIQCAEVLLVNKPKGSGYKDHIIRSVAFSPDGQLIASGSNNHLIQLWDLQGQPIGQPFQGHKGTVSAVAFSPDGQLIVSSSLDKTIRLWNWQGKQVCPALKGHEGLVNTVAFSPDGRLIASGSNDKTIRLWNRKGNAVGQPFHGHERSVNAIAFSPDGQTILSGSDDKTIRLWNLQGKPIVQPLRGHENAVRCVAFSPDGRLVASGSDDKTVRLWDLDGKLINPPFQGHLGAVRSVAFSPDGQLIASGSNDKTIRLSDLKGSQIGQPFIGHDDWVRSVAFSPDGQLIVSGSDDETIRLWNLQGNLLSINKELSSNLKATFASDLIHQALEQLSEEDINNKLKIAKLFAVHIQDLRASRELLIKIFQSGINPQIYEVLLSLMAQEDSSVKPIIDFLLDSNDPLPLVEQLVAAYLRSKDSSFQDTAFFLLASVNPIERENTSLFTKALLKLEPPLDILELYAQRLTSLESSSVSYLEVGKALIKSETINYALTSQLLEKSLQYDSSQRTEVISVYIQLGQLASKNNNQQLYKEFLSRALFFSNDFNEFSESLIKISRSYLNSRGVSFAIEHLVITGQAMNVGAAIEGAILTQNFNITKRDFDAFSPKAGSAGFSSSQVLNQKTKQAFIIERHTQIKFPQECILERKAELKIKLTKEIPNFTNVLEKISLAVGAKTKQVKLNVNVTAPGFAVRPYQQQLTVSVKGDSNEVIFTLVPLELGEQTIEIEFFKRATRVGYVLVKTNVKSYSVSETLLKVLSMEDPINGLNNLATMPVNPDKHTLHVNWMERESKLLYTIYPADRLGEWERTIPNIQQQIEDDLRNLNAFLTEVVQQGNPSDDKWDSICFNLQSVGTDLFNMLIPPEVAKRVRNWKLGSPVIISTNEQWIPWELMYDDGEFWGKKFIIARYPRLSDAQNLPDKSRPESKGERQIKRIVNVVGGDVPLSEADRAAQLFSTLLPPESVQLLSKQSIAALVKALPGADALHCTCHGHLEPHLLQIAGDKNKTRIENLLPETIQRLPLEAGSLVFANACASTVPVLTFGKFSSFGWKFYQRGAAAFIGTLGAVPVKYAVNFAEIVYRELFNRDERITIGQAVARAKEIAASERNLFWLLYCIYGDPDFSIVQQRNLEEEEHAN